MINSDDCGVGKLHASNNSTFAVVRKQFWEQFEAVLGGLGGNGWKKMRENGDRDGNFVKKIAI
jgi:hypothetical protein